MSSGARPGLRNKAGFASCTEVCGAAGAEEAMPAFSIQVFGNGLKPEVGAPGASSLGALSWQFQKPGNCALVPCS